MALLIPWGLGQQFALHTVFLREARDTFGRAAASCWRRLFAALHLPNPFLTAMTFAGALVWCWIYDRHPDLLPLALSHALLTLAILYAFDEAMTGHLRVGAAYSLGSSVSRPSLAPHTCGRLADRDRRGVAAGVARRPARDLSRHHAVGRREAARRCG